MQLAKLAIIKFFSKSNHLPIKMFLASLSILMIWGNPVSASWWVNTAQESFNATSPAFGVASGAQPVDPRQYLANIIQVILGFLGVICIILIILAGFTWMTAAGNKDKVEKAQQTLLAAIIGLFIILAAFSVTVFVTNAVLRANDRNAPIEQQDRF